MNGSSSRWLMCFCFGVVQSQAAKFMSTSAAKAMFRSGELATERSASRGQDFKFQVQSGGFTHKSGGQLAMSLTTSQGGSPRHDMHASSSHSLRSAMVWYHNFPPTLANFGQEALDDVSSHLHGQQANINIDKHKR